MDPRTFDGMIRQLAQTRSRRSLVGGSLGALVLAAVGLSDDEALATKKKAKVEACIPTGKKCPAKKPRGKKKKTLGCDQCCQRDSVPGPGRGKVCACRPDGADCGNKGRANCCSGVCDAAGKCAPSPTPPTCTGVGGACTANAACCNGICNAGGSTTGPLADTANECATCRTGRATCDPNLGDEQCCELRNCRQNPSPAATGRVCTSVTGEECIPAPDATATSPERGTCASAPHDEYCPVAGGVGAEGICCRSTGSEAPGGCPGTTGIATNTACCTQTCVNTFADLCCAPDNQNPTASNGRPCDATTADPVENSSCCSGFCTGNSDATSLCVAAPPP